VSFRWRAALALGAATVSFALEPGKPFHQYRVRHWTAATGLPHHRVQSAAQSSEGEVWISTPHGELAKYDGRRWTRIGNAPPVAWLLPDRQGGLIAISATGKGFHVDRDGVFRATTGQALASPLVAAAQSDDGRVWLADRKDLYNWADSQLKRSPNAGLGQLNALAPAAGNGVWVGASGGLFRVTGDGSAAEKRLEGRSVALVAVGRGGTVWAASGALLFRISGRETRQVQWTAGSRRGEILGILEDRHGNLWINTVAGIGRISESSRAGWFPLESRHYAQGVPTQDSHRVWEDREGQIWFGRGLDGLLEVADTPFRTDGEEKGLLGVVWAILDDGEGRRWASTSVGLFRSEGEQWRQVLAAPAQPNGTAALLNSGGNIWVSQSGTLLRLAGGRIQERIAAPRMVSLLAMADGSILGAAGGAGLWRIAGGKAEPFTPAGTLCPRPRVLAKGNDGAILVGCFDEGLYEIRNGRAGRLETGIRRLTVESLYVDQAGTIWLGSYRSGLCRLARGKVHWFQTPDQSGANDVHAIVEDRRGFLWLSSDTGVRRARKRDLDNAAETGRASGRWQHFDTAAGLRDAEFSGGVQPSAWMHPDGRAWMPSRSGLVEIQTGFRFDLESTPRPSLVRVRLGDRPLTPEAGRVSFVATSARLWLDLRAPVLSRPVAFAYRLAGFDDEWTYASPGEAFSYTNLPPGHYSLLVRTAPYGGEPGDPHIVLAIEVMAPFFKRGWFLVMASMALAAAGGAAVWLRGKAVRRRNSQLEEEVRRRTSELEAALRSEKEAVAAALARERDLKDTREQLAHSQKMESIGRLAGGVAHDFNNLLTVIFGNLELARMTEPLPPGHTEILEDIEIASRRASDLTRRLLTFAKRQVVEPRVVDLNALSAESSKLLRRLIGEDVEMAMRLCPDSLPVKVDTGQFEQVLINLVVNARDAMPQGGKITVETFRGSGKARLTVTDTGRGMPPEVLARLFEPFFTTKQNTGGTGLGLAICYGIVRQAGGEIQVTSSPGAGSCFEVTLPLSAAPLSSETTAASCGGAGGSETVLIVEDEARVRNLMAATLSVQGYRVLAAANGEEGLAAARNAGRIDLIVVDVVMPRMGGQELVTRLAREIPDARVLYISGYTGDAGFEDGEGHGFLSKPFTMAELSARVRTMLDTPDSVRRA
jgi:signal transduction histidine kinase/ligand-binding sensor domain-containing protein/CheY-like chemotaxis protein